ncbi:hypothetical protein J8273_8164 [Carpediemonas membranifera]|nr:hypothetical protein J8273_8164 [Carpediemonas membranifera]|eukprot:KAG9390126.1 hypothetical protein J8273_8164 [Carpediemonas membranifera]
MRSCPFCGKGFESIDEYRTHVLRCRLEQMNKTSGRLPAPSREFKPVKGSPELPAAAPAQETFIQGKPGESGEQFAFCPFCGIEMFSGQLFCGTCGAKRMVYE